MTGRLDFALGLVLGAVAGGLVIPATGGAWRAVRRSSPFVNAWLTIALASSASSAAFLIILFGLSFPARSFVDSWDHFRFVWMTAFLLAATLVRAALERRARHRKQYGRVA